MGSPASEPCAFRSGIRIRGARRHYDTAFPWGLELDHNYGSFGDDGHELCGKAEGRDVWVKEISPVGSFPPNAFGLKQSR